MFKNVYRLFLKKKFQLLAVGIIILISSFLYTTMYNAMNSVQKSMEELSEDYNQEDFTIELIDYLLSDEVDNKSEILKLYNLKKDNYEKYNEVINKRINTIKNEYPDVELELRESKDIDFKYNNQSITMRLLKDNKKINKTMVEEGRKPKNKNEIAVPKIFADKNNLKIGDSINIEDNNYKIVGYILVPDYTLLIFGNDFIFNNGKITIGILSEEDYESFDVKEKYNISGTFNKNVKENYFDDNNMNFIVGIKYTESNMNSGYIYNEVTMGKEMTVGLAMMISTIGIIIVAIIVYKFMQMERAQIGVLKALGYKNKEICRPYLILISVLALPMLIIGAILGYFCSEPLINLFSQFYLFPNKGVVFDIKVYIMAVIVPFIFFIGFSYLVIRMILNKKPLDLLRVVTSNKISIITKIIDKLLSKCKTTTKFKYSFLAKSKGKFIVFIIGFIFASTLIIMGLMIPGFYYKLSTEPYELEDYKYEAYVDPTKELPELKSGEEKNLTLNTKYEGKTITLKGLEKNNKLYKLYSNSKDNITSKLDKGVIISNSFKSIFDKKEGDLITININNKKETFEIVGVSKEYSDFTIYFDIEELSSLYSNGESSDIYTGIYSKNKIDSNEYSYVIDKDNIMEQSKSIQGFLYISLGIMIIFSIGISGIILFVLTSLTVEDNYYNISLLKVMGYTKKEVNSMILNSYLGYGIISYLITIPIAIFGMTSFMSGLGKKFNMALPFKFELWQGVVGLTIIIGIYLIGSFSARRKIEKIELQEILKEYRE